MRWKQRPLRVSQAVPFRRWGQMCRQRRAWAELEAVWQGDVSDLQKPIPTEPPPR